MLILEDLIRLFRNQGLIASDSAGVANMALDALLIAVFFSGGLVFIWQDK